ncbi:flagellar basal body L-ring protein FlgH [Limnohabitans sp. Rim47]|uniref:flagellar basal body L-ring protein FlgH n=1 Tax=Limnohabitans sp. Rim47 TaxID=1100721 RepID=UPI000312BD52|nr:flagellar basal body L-ring protein FlgH [Limnohabitans sp. Rim47]
MNTRFFLSSALWLALALSLTGCATSTAPMAHTPQFAPVLPVAVEKPRMATGAIYNGRQSDNWFGRVRAYNVGDVITVLLNESTQAGRTQSGTVKRAAKNDVIPSVGSAPDGLNARVQGLRLPTKILGTRLQGIMGGVDLSKANIESVGGGEADQQASLTGDVSVTVVDVLANGNLMVRGEKQLALTEGAEIIQVSGIIRPEDISPNNTVQSRRLANAQIAYRGTGDMANAAKAGWGTNALMKFWPF